jgi:hypothetical protein
MKLGDRVCFSNPGSMFHDEHGVIVEEENERGFIGVQLDSRPAPISCIDSELKLLATKAAGGTKHDNGKPDLSLLPFKALEDVARVMMFGAKKYGRDNWKLGFDEQRLVSAALRHLGAHTEGVELDEESGQSHLAHAACNLLFLIWLKKNGEKK